MLRSTLLLPSSFGAWLARASSALVAKTAEVAADGHRRATALLGMLAPVLDSNRDGSMVDDVVGVVGRLLSRR
jgi:hypothetical protein